MGHIYSPHYISVEPSQNISSFFLYIYYLLLYIDISEGRIYTCQYHIGSKVGCWQRSCRLQNGKT